MVIAFFVLALILAAATLEHLAWIRRAHNDLLDLVDEPQEIEHEVSSEVAKVETEVKKAV